MKIRDFALHLLRSPVGLVLLLGGGGAGLAVALASSSPLGGLTALPVWAIGAVALSRSRWGARQVLNEASRSRWTGHGAALEELEVLAGRLAKLRLSDPGLDRQADKASFVSRGYLELCRRERSWNPAADQAIRDCVEILDSWLAAQDQAASRRQFGTGDQPTESAEQSSLSERTAALLVDRIALITKACADLDSRSQPEDRLSIQEEL